MNILVISQYFWPEEFRINDVVHGLSERGHRVTVLTGMPNYPGGKWFKGYTWAAPRFEDYEGVKVIRAPMVSRGKGKGVRLVVNYLSFAVSACIAGSLYCDERYDAILVYEPSPVTVGIPAVWLRKLRKIPMAFWVQDLWPETLEAVGVVRSSRVLGWVGALVRAIYARCDLVLVQSRAFIASIESHGVAGEKIRYLPNSAEASYRPTTVSSDERRRLMVPDGFIVMFAGNIGAAQDFGTILQAAELLKSYPEIHWVVLGDGRMSGWVAEQVQARGISSNFHMLGRHPVEAMSQYFACADAMLVTLKDEPIFSYTVPAKVQSYLACGKPIAAALAGEGARIIEESGAGLAAPPENPSELAQAVKAMYEMSPEARHTMGQSGFEFFESEFQREKLLGRLEDWLEGLVRKGVV